MIDLMFGICGIDDAILGALLTVASAGAGVMGAQQSKRAANRATQAELQRQSGYQKKASSVFEQSLSGSTPEAAQTAMQTGEAARLADYAQQQSVPLTQPGTSPVGGQSSHLVTTASAGAQDRLANTARARMAGYNEWDVQQAIKDLRAEQSLSTLNNFSRQSQSLLPYELQNAAHAGDTMQGVGSLLGLGGSLVGGLGALNASRAATPSLGAQWTATAPGANPTLGMWGNVGMGAASTPQVNWLTGQPFLRK